MARLAFATACALCLVVVAPEARADSMEIQPGVEAAVYDWDTGLELDRNTAGGVTSGTYSTSLLEVSQGLEAIAGAMQTITS